ncbi:PREDICTED: arachidonate 5-lipoxygenase-activating protein [Lipotes vexillifer]|uniref:Arachidonate 5-lipoxygenase-activating protein n=1 Tax=Lipotes vexillifer TaxID=118797 RepID=A0A340WLM5_LIPVE|nr:PREDICTED: arachidonate 5-lipoxygenase-activating protein [Lipotes vexillifer]
MFPLVYLSYSQNCVDAYPTFLVMLWSAGLLCSQVPAAFAGLMYLVVRQKYFVGYLGERTQSTRGYIVGKRIILFLFLMSLAGIVNYFLILLFGSDFENYIKTIATTISPLLLIP